jgi:hypothetical protein
MRGVSVGSEANTPTGENGNRRKGQVRARFPCAVNAQRSLAHVDVAGTAGSVAVATVDAGTADQTVQPFLDCADGVHGTDKDPDLDHIASLPVIGRGREASRDNDPLRVFMKDESVQREPPFAFLITSRA